MLNVNAEDGGDFLTMPPNHADSSCHAQQSLHQVQLE